MEMRKEDQPPEYIWLDSEALTDHFERVAEKYKSGSGTEEVPQALDQNELTKGLR